MNLMEATIRESVSCTTGILIDEIMDAFNQETEVENARSIYFKLLMEYALERIKHLLLH